MAKNPRKSSGKTLSRSRGRNFAGDQASSRGTRKRAILPVGEAAAWERRRHDMADRDLVFRENFPPLPRKRERGRGGQKKNADGWKERMIVFQLTYVLAQSKYHKRTKLGGENYASTPQRALSERHGSFLHNGRAAIRACDRSVSARGQRRSARKRSSPPVAALPDAAQNPPIRRLRIDGATAAGGRRRTAQERRASVTGAGDATAFPRARLRRWEEYRDGRVS